MGTRGVTLIEVILVIVISTVIVGAAFPLGQRYLRRSELETAVRDFASLARYAQTKAQNGSFDDAWGVKVAPGAITMFRGASFAAKVAGYDQVVSIPDTFVIAGTSEYDFARLTGRTVAGTLSMTDSSGNVRAVTVNAFGRVDF